MRHWMQRCWPTCSAEDGFALPSEEPAIPRRATSARVLATPAQQRLWTVERIDGVTGEFNLGMDIRFNAPINVAALERALLVLLQRHEGLRAGFFDHDDGTLEQTFAQVDSFFLTQHAVPATSWPSFCARRLHSLSTSLPTCCCGRNSCTTTIPGTARAPCC